MTEDFDIEDFEDYVDANIYQPLVDLIKKLEERIIALERKESVVHILPSDNYYWEHG